MMEETEEYTWEKRYRALVDVLTCEFPPQRVATILSKMKWRLEKYDEDGRLPPTGRP